MENSNHLHQEESFDKIDLEKESDGSVADLEDDATINDLKGKMKVKRKKRVKKKIFFRSDFTGEKESSTESSDDEDKKAENRSKAGILAVQDMNPNDLTWVMWFWYYIVNVSASTFHAAEFCGEKLADFFGITSPKYQYVINEYHRLKQEEKEEEEAEQRASEYLRQKDLERISKLEGGGPSQVPDISINGSLQKSEDLI